MNYTDKPSTLRKSLIFSSLSSDELNELSKIVSDYSLNSGEYLFWEGDIADYFYIVAQGKVKVLKHASSGKEFIIAFFGPEEMFGEVAAFEKRPYPASAQVVSEVVVFRIRREDFISFLNSHPQVVLSIIDVLSERLRVAQARLRDLAAEKVEQSNILSITVVHMEVPCCSGLVHLAEEAIQASGKNIPLDEVTVSIRGEIVPLAS